jgi:hypothetical protein
LLVATIGVGAPRLPRCRVVPRLRGVSRPGDGQRCRCVLIGPQCRACCVHGHVTTTDHDHTLAHFDVEAAVHVDEELDGTEHPVGIAAFYVETPSQGRSNGEEDPIVASAKLLECHVDAHSRVVLDVYPETDDGVDVTLKDGAVEAVLGNSEPHGAAQLVRRLVDGHLVSPSSQVVSCGETGGPPSDDPDALLSLGFRGRGHLQPGIAILYFGSVLLRDEALERPDGDWPVDGATTTGVLTWCGAHPAAHGCERIGETRSQVGELVGTVGDGRHVHAGIGMNRAGGETWDVPVVERQIPAHIRS